MNKPTVVETKYINLFNCKGTLRALEWALYIWCYIRHVLLPNFSPNPPPLSMIISCRRTSDRWTVDIFLWCSSSLVASIIIFFRSAVLYIYNFSLYLFPRPNSLFLTIAVALWLLAKVLDRFRLCVYSFVLCRLNRQTRISDFIGILLEPCDTSNRTEYVGCAYRNSHRRRYTLGSTSSKIRAFNPLSLVDCDNITRYSIAHGIR